MLTPSGHLRWGPISEKAHFFSGYRKCLLLQRLRFTRCPTSVQLGMMFTGMALFAAVRSLGEGLIADRYGRKPVLIITSLLMAVCGLIFSVSQDLRVLTISAILFGVGRFIPFTPAEQAMLTEKVSSENRTTAFSVNSFAGEQAHQRKSSQ